MGKIVISEDCIIENDIPGFLSKYEPKWHHTLYCRWRHMWQRCRNPDNSDYDNYKDCPIDDRYHFLSEYVHDIQLLEDFDKLKENPSMYSIDKDKIDPNNRCYFFEHLSIIPSSENTKERNNRLGNPNPYIKDFVPIKGTHKDDGSTIILMTKDDLREKGFSISHINECLEGKRKTHGKYKWEYLIYDK